MVIDKSKEIQIPCPVCGKEKNYAYDASGKSSSRCAKCRRLILWDYDQQMAFLMRDVVIKNM